MKSSHIVLVASVGYNVFTHRLSEALDHRFPTWESLLAKSLGPEGESANLLIESMLGLVQDRVSGMDWPKAFALWEKRWRDMGWKEAEDPKTLFDPKNRLVRRGAWDFDGVGRDDQRQAIDLLLTGEFDLSSKEALLVSMLQGNPKLDCLRGSLPALVRG